MAGSIDHRHFIELSDHSVAVLRTSGPRNASVIEEYRDACLDDAEAVKSALNLAQPADAKAPGTVICSVRSDQSLLHLATAEEAAKHATPTALATFLADRAALEAAAVESAGVYADSGRIVDGSSKAPWFGVATNNAAKNALLAKLDGWGLKAERVESAALSLCGAVQGTLAAAKAKDTVIIWEVGKSTSDLVLVSARGVEGTRRVTFGFERITEAILAEIQLKFKGAAAKLFFNNRYDFSATGPKIAQRIADALATEVSQLVAKRSPKPGKFILSGFPSKQDWFAGALAPSLGLEVFNLNIEPWLGKHGIGCADKAALAGLSPAWLGTLGLAAAHSGSNVEKSPAWHPAWTAPTAAPAAQAQVKPAAAAAPAAQPQPQSTSATPARAVKPAAEPGKQQSPSGSSDVDQSRRKPQVRTKSPSLPPGVRIANPDTMGLSQDTVEVSKRKKGLLVRNLAFAALVLGLLSMGYLYFQSVETQKQAAMEARQLAQQQAAANERARFEAEQKARAEAAARQRAEEETAARIKAEEAARLKAEEAARLSQVERDRLLHARGSMTIASIPSGARVTVGNLESQLSPATFSDLRLGKYNAILELDGYEPARIEVTVEDDKVTTPAPVRLVRHTGKLEITTKPVGVHFEVKPASPGAFTTAMQSRIGITPHTLGSLPTDDYVVTLTREGWPSTTRTVTIDRDETTTLLENLAGGTVRITSNPSGASVFGKDDILLGITPLELEDLPAGDATFTIEHPDYNPVTLSGNVQVGAVTDLTTTLEPTEVLARISELDRKPSPTKRVEPTLADPKRFVGHNALITLTVNEQGLPENVEIEQASDAEFAQLCVEAVRQWEFKPGRIGRTPVRTKVKIPFTIQ